jgi:hypothetical protein
LTKSKIALIRFIAAALKDRKDGISELKLSMKIGEPKFKAFSVICN